jgi:hypothetical protein
MIGINAVLAGISALTLAGNVTFFFCCKTVWSNLVTLRDEFYKSVESTLEAQNKWAEKVVTRVEGIAQDAQDHRDDCFEALEDAETYGTYAKDNFLLCRIHSQAAEKSAIRSEDHANTSIAHACQSREHAETSKTHADDASVHAGLTTRQAAAIVETQKVPNVCKGCGSMVVKYELRGGVVYCANCTKPR